MNVRRKIYEKLKRQGYLWSEGNNVISDDVLIQKSLQFLEFEELNEMINFFGYDNVRNVWIRDMVTQGSYLETLNWLLALFFFHIEDPDAFLNTKKHG